MRITLDWLRAAVQYGALDVETAHARMAPMQRRMRPPHGANPRLAGVLVLTFPTTRGVELVLTRRPDTLRDHSGQISFPGGRRDPADDSFTATALRETCEELGLCDPPAEIIGPLTPIYVPPSNFEVHPVVAYLGDAPTFAPNPTEVAEVITVPVDWLLDEARKGLEPRTFGSTRIDIPYYILAEHKVWGATAVMLSELETRLRAVLDGA